MWVSDGWKDYELLDCGGGERLERWGKFTLVRPDPQAIWRPEGRHPGWNRYDARYQRSSTGGGRWVKKALPERWEDYPLADAKAYGAEEAEPLFACRKSLLRHGYDETKPPEAWTIEDMRQAAKFRGGKCLSEKMGKTPYDKLVWECCEGHTFEAAPYTVLIGGHWCPDCMPQPWEFGRLAKKMPYYAQVWYDGHAADENARYYLDDDGTARAEQGEEER